MSNFNSTPLILLLPGDGIGQEISQVAARVLQQLIEHGLDCHTDSALVGGSAYDRYGTPLPEETLVKARSAQAILFGAIGGPKWEDLDYSVRPERALLALRKELDLFANFRPAMLYSELADASSLKAELIEDLDLMIVRELTGGIYFGEPRGVSINAQGLREGVNTYRYNEAQIRRVAKVAFEASLQRGKRLCSVDKANVLEVTELWRQVINEVAKDYASVEVSHMYVDNAAMQLLKNPKQFDVIVTGNLFGDILSDMAAMLTGSIGMLPSASLNDRQQGLYEPVHGSAPDIAGANLANPIASILSLAMLLRLSLHEGDYADAIEQAVRATLSKGYRTADIATANVKPVSTSAMGELVQQELKLILA